MLMYSTADGAERGSTITRLSSPATRLLLVFNVARTQ